MKTKPRNDCSTRAKRDAIAHRFRKLADEHCLGLEAEDFGDWLVIDISKGPYACMVDLDPSLPQGSWLTHWHMVYGHTASESATFGSEFAIAARADVNPTHKHKATGFFDTLDDAMASIASGFDALTDPIITPADQCRALGCNATADAMEAFTRNLND